MTIALIIFSLIVGVALGFWFFSKHPKTKGYINLSTTYTIYLLIFSMGMTVGNNKTLIESIFSVGWQAIFIAFCAMIGSILTAILFFKNTFKKTKA